MAPGDQAAAIMSAADDYAEHHLYVRVLMKPGTARVPVDEVVSENPDKMSMAVIKFGTTTNLQTEDKYYAGDGGFFLCSFPLLESGEAETVNDIVCVDYADALLECDGFSPLIIDAPRLAAIENVHFSPDNYDEYIVLAERFFLSIVGLLSTIWPGKFRHLGYSYGLHVKRAEFSPNREPLRVEVRRREIDDAMVARNRKQLRTMQDEKLTGEVSMLCRWSALNAAQ